MRSQSTIGTTLYCSKCGNRGIPIRRKTGKQKESFHKKKLYCIYCRTETNHIECKNEEDVKQFLEDFEAGLYE